MEVQEIKASEARRWLDEGRAELIDIRDSGERGQMRIPEARWIPLDRAGSGPESRAASEDRDFPLPQRPPYASPCGQTRNRWLSRDVCLGRGHHGLEESGLSSCFRFRSPDRNHAPGSDCGGQLGSTGRHLGSMGSSWVFRTVCFHRSGPPVFRCHWFLQEWP